MSEGLLTVLSVIGVVTLVAVLGIGLLIVARQLRQIASTLAEVAWGARAVERQLRATGPNVRQVNTVLEDISRTLPGVVDKAERKSRGTVRS
ncbi:MAG: hypothetical protein M3459_02130 [Actinomycetota bacterium]|nr:hypothetical protein [Actinomycetota bacterium]